MASIKPGSALTDMLLSLSPPASPELGGINVLHSSHSRPLKRAIERVLDTTVASETYAQIIDGLPTRQCLHDFQARVNQDHPVIRLCHNEICQASLEKTREFKTNFNILSLRFPLHLLLAYQDTTPEADPYNALEQEHKVFRLRLMELIAVACHQIAVYLYQLEVGPHKHSEYYKWRDGQLDLYEPSRLPSAFCHNSYHAYLQYPNGIADCAGYWAEAKIFGGVIVFDRAREETNTFFIHPSSLRGPKTIYAPTVDQFTNLSIFLLHPDDIKAQAHCPLPMTATRLNRYRWDPWDAMAIYNIYRDPYERAISLERPHPGRPRSTRDFPEDQDIIVAVMDMYKPGQGIPVDEKEVEEREKRMREITPSSPLWHPDREYTGVVLGRDS